MRYPAKTWLDLALYLADCHAATAEYEGTLKSVPIRRKDRYAAICEKCVSEIKRLLQETGTTLTEQQMDSLRRCESAAAGIRAQGIKP